ncbi:MAG: hypothetical protein QOK31_1696 [Solirubrobacteraceae bacterium]|nr:hypothetical protein [Solirubrobacteraceae bacterium]
MMRRLSLTMAVALAGLAFASVPAHAQSIGDLCGQASPSSAFCIGQQKLAEAAGAECRRLGLPAANCNLPLSREVRDDITGDYGRSWLHRAAAFQYRLGGPLPLLRAQWLGTHNSFNSTSESPTLSHTDSNQQLSLSQQLNIDIRGLELDLHWFPSATTGGAKTVVVCHARGPDEENAGCTNERTFVQVLPEIANWLNTSGHRREVVLLYLEDELGDPAGYAQTVATLDHVLRRPDGHSLIYRPRPSDIASKGCASLPLGISRERIRARGAQVLLVGNCRSGWAADVYGWDDRHVESGSTPRYRAFPACDATYSRRIYDTKLVRYYEDSTFVSAATDPTGSPSDAQADRLTPDKAAAMTRCGVGLFGFDQLLPNDGRIGATIWSWASGQPSPQHHRCTVQRTDGHWVARGCRARRRAACATAHGWLLTRPKVPFAESPEECRDRHARFVLPRTGYDNSRLRQAARRGEVWIAYRVR